MNYFVYIKNLLGISTNLDSVSWVYGSSAPKTDKDEYEKCKIKINLQVKKTEDVFDKSLNIEDFDRYNYFYAHRNERKIYYERTFLFNSKLRYSIEIRDDKQIDIIVNKNYFKYIKFKFMNLHSIGYILTDLASGLLLNNGYATLHCSSVKSKTGLLLYLLHQVLERQLLLLSYVKMPMPNLFLKILQ